MKSNRCSWGAAVRVIVLSLICSSTARAVEFNWNVSGPATWEDVDNWEPSGVPNSPTDIAIFENVGSFGSPVTIDQDGSLGPITAKLQYDNAFVTHTSTGGHPHTLDDGSDRPHITVIDGDVLFEQGLNLQMDTLIKLGSNQLLGGFSRLTFNEPIDTNDNDITFAVQPNITGLITMAEDVADPNNMGNVKLRNAFLELNLSLTAQATEVSGGQVFVPNASSQLKVPALTLQRGGAFTIGDSADPLPDLTQNVQMSAGAFNNSGTQVANVPQGATLVSGHNAFDAGFGASSGFNFLGALESSMLGTANFKAFNPGTQFFGFDDAFGLVGGGIIPYATFNNDNFARYDGVLNRVERLSTYLNDINAAGPTDPVEVTGTQTLTDDRQAAVVKLGASAAVDLNDHTLTTHSLLVTDFDNTVTGGVIVPVAGPIGVLYIHVPQGNDNLALNNVDIANNGTIPAKLVVSGNGLVTIDNTLSKTGDTHINAGAALHLNGPSADPGGLMINLGDGGGFPASLVLQDTTLTQNIVATPSTFDPFPTDGIVAGGTSTVSGDIDVRSDKEAPRTLGLGVPNADDMLTIAGNIGPDDPNTDAFNIKIQGAGTVELVEGTTHTVSGDIVLSFVTLRNNGLIRSPPFIPVTAGFEVILRDDGKYTGDDGEIAASIFFSVAFGLIDPGNSIGKLSFGGDVAFTGTEGPATYRAEVTDDGQADKLDIDGLLDLSGTNDFLELDFFSGSTLSGSYTLATYGQIAGVFDNVTFQGITIADPTSLGAIGGTHQLFYGPTALQLTTMAALPGDFDGDGDVDGRDFLAWQRDPSIGDLADWQANYGNDPVASATIPEPAPGAFALLAALIILGPRRASCHTPVYPPPFVQFV